MGAMAYGIDGPSLDLKDVSDLLSALQKEKRLIQNSLEPPIVVALTAGGRTLFRTDEILDYRPRRRYAFYLKNASLTPTFRIQLLSSGFRLLDGRAGNAGNR